MTDESDPRAEQAMIDERIRRIADDPDSSDCPAGIGDRVQGRVRRRRRAYRSGYAAAALAALTAIGLATLSLPDSTSPRSQLANETKGVQRSTVSSEDPRFAEIDSEYLATPPPVFSLDLISENQLAMLDCLEALEEEFE